MEDTTFYRAKLVLEKVEPYADPNGYPRERTAEIAAHTVTGDTPADAMVQLCTHANALHDWHEDQADDEQLPALDEAVKLGPPLLDLSKMFQGIAATTKVRHRCTICGTLGPIAHEGNTWICAGCNTILDAQKAEAEKAHLYPNVITRETAPAAETFVACKATVPDSPGIYCGHRLGHQGDCWYVAPAELDALEHNEPDALDNASAAALADREAEFRTNMHLAQAGIPHRLGPPTGPIVITSPPVPDPALIEAIREDIAANHRRRPGHSHNAA